MREQMTSPGPGRLAFASLVALAVCGGLTGSLASLAAQDARRSIWDGVYTAAQATRGQQAYKDHCGYCHRDNLTGGGSEAGAPALLGPIFTYRWRDLPIADLFITIGTTMPQNKPDTLEPATVIDIVSFVLKANNVPEGPIELPPDVERLKTIAMATARP